MNIAVDLHIHSALSPCADDDMTPNNIVNMAILKKLDAIAVTDHNSCDNAEAIVKLAGSQLIVVPGMEVETKEEVHVLCYFEDVDKLLDFGELIRTKLPSVANIPQIFGNQLIIDENDQIIGEREELLISSIDLSIDQTIDEVYSRGGVLVPAHIDRSSYSVISQLGFIPENLKNGMIEISRDCNILPLGCTAQNTFYSSDAHHLWDILERETFFRIDKLSVLCILRGLEKAK
ncbi:MAG: PHP domain-containing protein [Clostridiales bacterium]|nr:PHP domain-containing protein [Clostridiales bacterium]